MTSIGDKEWPGDRRDASKLLIGDSSPSSISNKKKNERKKIESANFIPRRKRKMRPMSGQSPWHESNGGHEAADKSRHPSKSALGGHQKFLQRKKVITRMELDGGILGSRPWGMLIFWYKKGKTRQATRLGRAAWSPSVCARKMLWPRGNGKKILLRKRSFVIRERTESRATKTM